RSTEREPPADAHRQVQDLRVREARAQATEEVIVERVVIEREAFGVLDCEPLAVAVSRMRLPFLDVRVVRFGELTVGAWRRAPLPADRAVVDQPASHAGDFPFA